MTVIDESIPDMWTHLVQILPAILPDKNIEEDAKNHYPLIKKACDDAGLSAIKALEQLNSVISALVKQAKKSGCEEDLRVSSSSDDDEEAQHEKENEVRSESEGLGKSILEGEQLSALEFHSLIEDPDSENNFIQFLARFTEFEKEDQAEKNAETDIVEIPQEASNGNQEEDDDIQIIYEEGNDSDVEELNQDSLMSESIHSGPISPLQTNITDTFEFPYVNQSTSSASSKPTCACCGNRVSKRSVTHCRPCSIIVNAKKRRESMNMRQTDQPTCNSCGNSVSSRSKGLCRSCNWGHSNKMNSSGNNSLPVTPRIPPFIPFDPIEGSREVRMYKIPSTRTRITCIRCNQDRVKFAQQMCQICYKAYRKENNLIVVKRESFDDMSLSRNFSFRPSTSSDRPSTFLRQPKVEIDDTPVLPKRIKLEEEVVEQEIATPVSADENIPRRNRKTNTCVGCQTAIYPESNRCKDCHYASKRHSKDQGNLSSTLDSSTRSERKSRNCLQCEKPISIYGRSGYCHQCFFDRRKNESTKANNSTTKTAKSSENVPKTPHQSSGECVICQEPFTRRTTTGTCSRQCYKRLYNMQKNQTTANAEEPAVQISQESVQSFSTDPQTCQSCWSVDQVNQRRLCKECHEKEYSAAENASSTSDKTVLEIYLEQTEHYLNDN